MAGKKGMRKVMDNLSLIILSLILIGGIVILTDDKVTASNHPFCGDTICDPNEDSVSCPTDCFCGDEVCDATETPASCEIDCGYCGDTICSSILDEDAMTCEDDCGTCGNTICNVPEEDSNSCSEDCFCGDEVCDITEDYVICRDDCCEYPLPPPGEPDPCAPS